MAQRSWKYWLALGLMLLAACSPTDPAEETKGKETAVPPSAANEQRDEASLAARYADYEIITLLPRDAIPAIDNPEFLTAAAADRFYDPDELIIGVAINGEARAYSVPLLSSHEIVNDTVGGRKIAVTW